MKTVAAILKHKGHQVTTIEATATIAQVVDVLAERRIGAVLVIDRADQLLGIVSERDIMRSHRGEWRAHAGDDRGTSDDAHPAGGASRDDRGGGNDDDDDRPLPPLARDGSRRACRPDQHRRRGEGSYHGEGERSRQSEDVRCRDGLTATLSWLIVPGNKAFNVGLKVRLAIPMNERLLHAVARSKAARPLSTQSGPTSVACQALD